MIGTCLVLSIGAAIGFRLYDPLSRFVSLVACVACCLLTGLVVHHYAPYAADEWGPFPILAICVIVNMALQVMHTDASVMVSSSCVTWAMVGQLIDWMWLQPKPIRRATE